MKCARAAVGASFVVIACTSLSACGVTGFHTGAVLPKGPAAAVQAARNAVTVSPLPGTIDASPRTEIDFLGGKGTKVLKIHVVASKTKFHGGKLKAYTTGDGASFIPRRPFAKGETVAVYALVRTHGKDANVGTIFKIARQARGAQAAPRAQASSRRQGATPSLASVPPPDKRRLEAILRENPYGRELRDAKVDRNGNAWIDVFDPVEIGRSPRARVFVDSVIEEIDTKSGLVMWEWHALGHIHASAPSSAPSNAHASGAGSLRYVDIRAIEPICCGRLELFAANPEEVYAVSIHTGAPVTLDGS